MDAINVIDILQNKDIVRQVGFLLRLACKVGNGKIYDSEFKVSFPEVNLLLALPQ
jgi:hypothetical protein